MARLVFVVFCSGWFKPFFGSSIFRLKLGPAIGIAPFGGSSVGVGWVVVTHVSEPPRGCCWETDLNALIGLRMLTLSRDDQSLGIVRTWYCSNNTYLVVVGFKTCGDVVCALSVLMSFLFTYAGLCQLESCPACLEFLRHTLTFRSAKTVC